MAEILILVVLVTLVVGAVLLAHADVTHGEAEAEDWAEHDERRPS
ncbi:MAG: hypothetical protein ABW219_02095 [Ilumatobacteraceae bacterium]